MNDKKKTSRKKQIAAMVATPEHAGSLDRRQTIAEAAVMLGVAPDEILFWIRGQGAPHTKTGGVFMVDSLELFHWAEHNGMLPDAAKRHIGRSTEFRAMNDRQPAPIVAGGMYAYPHALSVAAHEAGHAIVAKHLGARLTEVRLATQDKEGHYVNPHVSFHWERAEDATPSNMALLAMSGPAGEMAISVDELEAIKASIEHDGTVAHVSKPLVCRELLLVPPMAAEDFAASKQAVKIIMDGAESQRLETLPLETQRRVVAAYLATELISEKERNGKRQRTDHEITRDAFAAHKSGGGIAEYTRDTYACAARNTACMIIEGYRPAFLAVVRELIRAGEVTPDFIGDLLI